MPSSLSSFGSTDPESLGTGGSVTAPGAGGAICTLATPPAGVYEVAFGFLLSGTAETALNNVRIRKGATTIITGLPTITGAACIKGVLPRVSLDGATSLAMQATAAATAGAVYGGWLVATRIA
jgi:hypothetical protein